MKVNMEGVSISPINNGLLIESQKELYVLANRNGFDFQYKKSFDNHYYNEPNIERILVEKHGISVISTVEFFEKKFFTNITLLLDVDLDNATMMSIYKTVIETISTVSWKVNAINQDELSNKLGNYYNMVYVVCKDKAEQPLSFDISLFFEVKELVEEALLLSFKNLGFDKTVQEV